MSAATNIVISPKRPGDLLRELMKKKGMKQGDLAWILGRPRVAVNEIVNGKRGISVPMAVALAAAFGDDPEFGNPATWLRLQSARRLWELDQHGGKGLRDSISVTPTPPNHTGETR